MIGSPFPRASTYSFASQEVKQTSFRIDGILNPPPYASELPVYFVEVMGYPDREGDLYPSLFSEIFLYLNDYRPINDWRAVLIFTRRRLDPGLPVHYQDFADNPRLQRIYLDELPNDIGDRALELGVIHLIGMKEAIAPERGRAFIERVQTEITDARTQQKFLELIETVFIYKFPELTRREIEFMLGLSELKQTKVYQEALQEGEASILLRLLTRKLGLIQPETQSQIQALSSDQLEKLADACLDFSNPADLTRWLQAL